MTHGNTHSLGLCAFPPFLSQNSILQGPGMESEQCCILMATTQMQLWHSWGTQALCILENSLLGNPWDLIFFQVFFLQVKIFNRQQTDAFLSLSHSPSWHKDLKTFVLFWETWVLQLCEENITISDFLLANKFLKYLFQLRISQTHIYYILMHIKEVESPRICCKEVCLSQSIQSAHTVFNSCEFI